MYVRSRDTKTGMLLPTKVVLCACHLLECVTASMPATYGTWQHPTKETLSFGFPEIYERPLFGALLPFKQLAPDNNASEASLMGN